jgi:hypothetical protein
MSKLRNSQGVPGIPDVHAGLRLLRGEAYSAHWTVADSPIGDYSQAPRGAQGLDGTRPQRTEFAPVRKRFNGPWPGALYGTRQPDPQETPLSWGEVHHAVREGLL